MVYKAPPPTDAKYSGERNAQKIEGFLDPASKLTSALDYKTPIPDYGEQPVKLDVSTRQYMDRNPAYKYDILSTCLKDGSAAKTLGHELRQHSPGPTDEDFQRAIETLQENSKNIVAPTKERIERALKALETNFTKEELKEIALWEAGCEEEEEN